MQRMEAEWHRAGGIVLFGFFGWLIGRSYGWW